MKVDSSTIWIDLSMCVQFAALRTYTCHGPRYSPPTRNCYYDYYYYTLHAPAFRLSRNDFFSCFPARTGKNHYDFRNVYGFSVLKTHCYEKKYFFFKNYLLAQSIFINMKQRWRRWSVNVQCRVRHWRQIRTRASATKWLIAIVVFRLIFAAFSAEGETIGRKPFLPAPFDHRFRSILRGPSGERRKGTNGVRSKIIIIIQG